MEPLPFGLPERQKRSFFDQKTSLFDLFGKPGFRGFQKTLDSDATFSIRLENRAKHCFFMFLSKKRCFYRKIVKNTCFRWFWHRKVTFSLLSPLPRGLGRSKKSTFWPSGGSKTLLFPLPRGLEGSKMSFFDPQEVPAGWGALEGAHLGTWEGLPNGF